MVVQAYILVQTNVGKAAEVANDIGAIQGVTLAEDVTGPYDVIVRAEASSVDELGSAGGGQGPDRPRNHPYRDLPRRAHLILEALRASQALETGVFLLGRRRRFPRG